MVNAWVVRRNPNGNNRLEEFLKDDLVAIGWHGTGDLSDAEKSQIRDRIEERHEDWSPHKVGQAVGQIHRFVNKMAPKDYVLVPSGGDVYFGRVDGGYRWESELSGDDGYAHQRDVDWMFGKRPIDRSAFPGRLHDSLKCQLTVFSVDVDHVGRFIDRDIDPLLGESTEGLQERYLKRLQEGDIPGVNANSFEGSVVKTILDNYFPGLTREATSSDSAGDTDLLTELPGDITVRIQVKHFYPDEGKLGEAAVEQLAKSMSLGDRGIVVTSTEISNEAKQFTDQSKHDIGFIDGEKLVELLFEDIRSYSDEELGEVGLRRTEQIRSAADK